MVGKETIGDCRANQIAGDAPQIWHEGNFPITAAWSSDFIAQP